MEAEVGLRRLPRRVLTGEKTPATTRARTMVAKKGEKSQQTRIREAVNSTRKKKNTPRSKGVWQLESPWSVSAAPPDSLGSMELFTHKPQGCKEKKPLIDNHLGKTAKKMIYDPASDDGRHCRKNHNTYFSADIHTKFPLFY
jgi:hypothetical protein